MKLYYSPGACSLADHIALIESGRAFETERVDLKAKTAASGKDYTTAGQRAATWPRPLADEGLG